jgi:hypothetical protein
VAMRRATATAAAVVLGLTVSGCSSSGDASSTALTSSTSSPSWSAAPTAANRSQDAQSDAVAFVSTYLGMIDDLRLDPSRSLDDIYEVAVAPEATAQASAIGELRSQDYRQTGRSRLVTAAVEGAPGNSDAAAPPGLPTVVVSACVDVTDVGAVDAAGQSVVPPGRPGFLIAQLTMVNPRQIDASSWRVSEAVNRQAQSCSG